MLDEGLYSLTYKGEDNGRREFGDALAVLRNGKILGSDRWGGVFTGSYEFDTAEAAGRVHLSIDIPPGGELVTGFAAGPHGAAVEIVSRLESPSPAAAVIEVAGAPVEVHLKFLGPLPA